MVVPIDACKKLQHFLEAEISFQGKEITKTLIRQPKFFAHFEKDVETYYVS